MNKYIVEYDGEYFTVTDDDPSYDGPVTNVADDEFVYHIEADTPEEAMDIAEQEYAIDLGC